MNKKIIGLASLSALLLPVLAFAAVTIPTAPTGGVASIDSLISSIADFAWKVLVGIGVIMFIVAGIMLITAQGDPEKVGKARQALLWGVAGIVVGILAFSIFTIVTTAVK